MPQMFKADAVYHYKRFILPDVQAAHEPHGVPNYPERQAAWKQYLAKLRTEGKISSLQVWGFPLCCKPKKK